MNYRHFLKMDHQSEWSEVTKNEWIKAERSAGFRPKLWSGDPEYMTTYATAGFSGNGVSGRLDVIPD